jgi:hypothetical protein
MQDPIIQDNKQESRFRLSVELINGYYLSFLAIGLLLIILRNDISSDLKQALFIILYFNGFDIWIDRLIEECWQ